MATGFKIEFIIKIILEGGRLIPFRKLSWPSLKSILQASAKRNESLGGKLKGKGVRIQTPLASVTDEIAEMRNICVIPSCVLFECVNNVLKGIPHMRHRIEENIVENKGLLTNFH